MARTLSNWEYRILVSECQDLADRRLEKIYEPQDGLFRLDFAFGDSLVVKLGEYFFRTRSPPAAPMMPSAYAMLVRKYLEGRKLASFEAHPSDRVYTLKFQDAGTLVFEQFAGGNMFLLDGQGKIVRPYHFKPSEKKRYHPGEKYAYPQAPPFDLPPGKKEWEVGVKERPTATLASILARWPIGKCYTNEALIRLGLEGKKASEITETQMNELLGLLAEMMKSPGACVYEKSVAKEAQIKEEAGADGRDENAPEQMLEVSLVPLHSQALGICKPFPTFSEAAEYFFAHAQPKEEEGESPHLIKLRHRLAEQQNALAGLEVEIHSENEKTRWLEEHLADLEEEREKRLNGKKIDEKKEKKWIVKC